MPTARHKLLYVIGQLESGGAERQLLYLLRGLRGTPYVPAVGVLSTGSVIPDYACIDVPLVFFRQFLPRLDISRLLRLLWLIRRIRPHLMHAFLRPANFYATLAGIITGVPVIVSERSARPFSPQDRPTLGLRAERLVIPRAAALIANSRAGATLAQQRLGVTPEKIHVVYNGLDPAWFDLPLNPQAIRRELGLQTDLPVIGIIGSLTPAKDHDNFFRAMAVLSQQSSQEFQILCVGAGPRLKPAKRLAQELGLGPRTIFTGLRQDMPRIMAAVDVLVSSSRWEGMSNVIMEAMAAGKPVVATAVGGTPELVISGETGVLVPAKDPSALSEAVQRILADRALAIKLGAAGCKRLEQYFSVDQLIANTLAIYRKVLSSL